MVPEYVLKYAPLVWLHSADPFRPSDLLQHIEHTTPRANYEPVPDLPDLNLENLAVLNEVRDGVAGSAALTSDDDVLTQAPWLLGQEPDAETGRIANVTACVVVLVEKGEDEMDAFYWYFYSYDRGPNITQVTEPLNGIFGDSPPDYSFGDHVGDWEHNMIRFKEGEPVGIYYSQHRDGASYDWNDGKISKKDERPIVFSAYGSHANYASAGDNLHDLVLIDYCDEGLLWDPVLSAYAYQFFPDTSVMEPLTLPDSEEAPASVNSFIYYRGIWGDEQYPDSHPDQQTVPYLGLKRFVSGPTGPIRKSLIRKDISPEARTRSWVEWAVGTFMSWYPCCIRGWRKWFSIVAVVAVLFFAGWGAKFFITKGVKRYVKKKEYTRLDADIPMEDMEPARSGQSSEQSSRRGSIADDRV